MSRPSTRSGWGGPSRDDRINAVVEVNNAVRRKALLAHATQVDPNSPFWFGLPDDVADSIHPYEEYMLLESRISTEPMETRPVRRAALVSFLDEEFLTELGHSRPQAAWRRVGHRGDEDRRRSRRQGERQLDLRIRRPESLQSPGTTRGADLTLEVPWQLAADVICGEADPAEHYMSGDLKVSGDMALWLELLPAWRAAGTLGAPPAA